MIEMVKQDRQDLGGMVGHLWLDELAELAKHVERGITHHRSWIPDASAHDGQKCWQVPNNTELTQNGYFFEDYIIFPKLYNFSLNTLSEAED